MTRFLVALLLATLCACSSSTSGPDEAVQTALTQLSAHEIFPMTEAEVSRLLEPVRRSDICGAELLADGFEISCAEPSRDAALATLRRWLTMFETDVDAAMTAPEKRNGALLSARVEGSGRAWVATIVFRKDPGLEGLR